MGFRADDFAENWKWLGSVGVWEGEGRWECLTFIKVGLTVSWLYCTCTSSGSNWFFR